MSELKPCPFCGSKRITEAIISDYHAFSCNACHATGMVLNSSAKYIDVVRAWNNRPIEDTLNASISDWKADANELGFALDTILNTEIDGEALEIARVSLKNHIALMEKEEKGNP